MNGLELYREKIESIILQQFRHIEAYFTNSKKECGVLTVCISLPLQIASDRDNINVSRKLGLDACKRRKNHQNPIGSDWVNGRSSGRSTIIVF